MSSRTARSAAAAAAAPAATPAPAASPAPVLAAAAAGPKLLRELKGEVVKEQNQILQLEEFRGELKRELKGELKGSAMHFCEFELGPDSLPPIRLWVEVDGRAGEQGAPMIWLQRGRAPTRAQFGWRKGGGVLRNEIVLMPGEVGPLATSADYFGLQPHN